MKTTPGPGPADGRSLERLTPMLIAVSGVMPEGSTVFLVCVTPLPDGSFNGDFAMAGDRSDRIAIAVEDWLAGYRAGLPKGPVS